jgi:protease I
MRKLLAGRCVAVLAGDGVQQEQLVRTMRTLRDAGADVALLSVRTGEIQAVRRGATGERFAVDAVVHDADARRYLGLVLPGGLRSTDALSADAGAVSFVRAVMELDKPVAASGDAAALLAAADMMRGRTVTSARDERARCLDAGAEWVDRPVVVDQRLVTCRGADDEPAFQDALVEALAKAAANTRVDESSEESFPASDSPAWGPSSIGPDRDAPHHNAPPP